MLLLQRHKRLPLPLRQNHHEKPPKKQLRQRLQKKLQK